MEITERNSFASPFLNLPAEIRNPIWKESFVKERVQITVYHAMDTDRSKKDVLGEVHTKARQEDGIEALKVSKQIHREGTSILYYDTVFEFAMPEDLQLILVTLTPLQRKCMRNLSITIADGQQARWCLMLKTKNLTHLLQTVTITSIKISLEWAFHGDDPRPLEESVEDNLTLQGLEGPSAKGRLYLKLPFLKSAKVTIISPEIDSDDEMASDEDEEEVSHPWLTDEEKDYIASGVEARLLREALWAYDTTDDENESESD